MVHNRDLFSWLSYLHQLSLSVILSCIPISCSSFDIIVDAELAVGPMETVDSILADMCLSQSLGLEPNEYQSADPDAANSVIYTSVSL